jgi:serine/threonine-protein kinase RsbW
MLVSDIKNTDQLLTINSAPTNIVHVEPFIVEFCNSNHICDEVYGNMLVCVTEAVNNAILHGNKTDINKRVTLEIKSSNNIVTIYIKDEGPGFDFNNLPDPTAPENIENMGGRGIYLMKHLADLVVFSNEGSFVEIQFKL